MSAESFMVKANGESIQLMDSAALREDALRRLSLRDIAHEAQPGEDALAHIVTMDEAAFVALVEEAKQSASVIHSLDSALLCDVCKHDYFVFTHALTGTGGVINADCPSCHESISTIHDGHWESWCLCWHPELLARWRPPVIGESE